VGEWREVREVTRSDWSPTIEEQLESLGADPQVVMAYLNLARVIAFGEQPHKLGRPPQRHAEPRSNRRRRAGGQHIPGPCLAMMRRFTGPQMDPSGRPYVSDPGRRWFLGRDAATRP
jgi:hypothetical protein